MYQNIMVPLDGSELAECVLPHVENIAVFSKATVELVRIVEPLNLPTRGGIALTEEAIKQIEMQMKDEAESYLSKTRDTLSGKGVANHSTVIVGKAAESLIDYARSSNADLIIMATHGRSGISRWFRGSVAERVLHASHIPVLLVQAPGWPPTN